MGVVQGQAVMVMVVVVIPWQEEWGHWRNVVNDGGEGRDEMERQLSAYNWVTNPGTMHDIFRSLTGELSEGEVP